VIFNAERDSKLAASAVSLLALVTFQSGSSCRAKAERYRSSPCLTDHVIRQLG